MAAAAARPGSSGPGSDSASNIELPAVQGMNKLGTLPEEWTLPHEWKIEKRELFDNWKMDVQSQISNISRNLTDSLQSYPHPEVGDRLTSLDQSGEAAGRDQRMQLGVSRGVTFTGM